jgi:exonuclease VII large subunit
MTAFDGPDIAQAIVQASVPVVLAVGHATDFHTADLVAHTSLPTPSAAAD